MPIVWDIATSKKVYFSHTIDQKHALSTGQYTAVEPAGGEDAYLAERSGDTPKMVMDATERARLGGPVSAADRDMLGAEWVEAESDPLPVG